jgi:hypothetical protein
MRRITNSTYISLDRVILNLAGLARQRHRARRYRPQGAHRPAPPLRVRADRRAHPPGLRRDVAGRSGDPHSDRINTMTKYVVSSTLRDPE